MELQGPPFHLDHQRGRVQRRRGPPHRSADGGGVRAAHRVPWRLQRRAGVRPRHDHLERHRARSRRGGAGRQPDDRDHDRPRRGARDRSGRLADLPCGRAAADRRHRARLARDAGDLPGSRSRGAAAVVHVGATPGADRIRGRRGARRYLVPGRDRTRRRVARGAGRDLGRDRRAAPARPAGPRDRPDARDAGEGSSPTATARRRDRGRRSTRPRRGRPAPICGQLANVVSTPGAVEAVANPVREPTPARDVARRAHGIARRTAGQWGRRHRDSGGAADHHRSEARQGAN